MKEGYWLWFSFLLGVLVTIMIWICFAEMTEGDKVRSGFLTYENKTYKVELYDTLDIPKKDKK